MSAKPSFYKPELDALRFFAFLTVFISHVPDSTKAWAQFGAGPLSGILAAAVRAGALGVDLFFVLSAYLITELLLKEREATGGVHVPRFLARRALRIWPLYFAFLLASPLLDQLVGKAGLSVSATAAFATFFGNFWCAAYGYPASVATPLWSVSIEEQFYLAWPSVVRKLTVTGLQRAALVLFATALVARLMFLLANLPGRAVWCTTFTRVDTIAVGIALVWLFRNYRIRLGAVYRTLVFLGAGVVWVVREWAFPLSTNTLGGAFGYSLTTLAAGAMLVAVLDCGGQWTNRAWLLYLGRISYGLYVFHFLPCTGSRTSGFILGSDPWWLYL